MVNKDEHRPNSVINESRMAHIDKVRKGNVAEAQRFLKQCSYALRGRLDTGGANICAEYACYLATCLRRFANNPHTARLFCLNMPKHRPDETGNPVIQLDRARAVLKKYQSGGTITSAIESVAKEVRRGKDAVRKSWKAHGARAKFELLMATPKNQRNIVRLPGARGKSDPSERG